MSLPHAFERNVKTTRNFIAHFLNYPSDFHGIVTFSCGRIPCVQFKLGFSLQNPASMLNYRLSDRGGSEASDIRGGRRSGAAGVGRGAVGLAEAAGIVALRREVALSTDRAEWLLGVRLDVRAGRHALPCPAKRAHSPASERRIKPDHGRQEIGVSVSCKNAEDGVPTAFSGVQASS